MTHAEDTEYETYKIEHVTVRPDDPTRFTLSFGGGSCIGCANPDKLPLPQVGETARLYGRGFGYRVRGISVGPIVYFYHTAEEDVEHHKQEVAKNKRERAEAFEKNRPDWEARVAKLTGPFQERITRFQRTVPEWDHEFGSYELFVCEEAEKILDVCATENAVVEFQLLEWDAQKERVPTLDYDKHSGNTFGATCMLARVYRHDASLIPQVHGALCPLVGCKEYGCYAAYEGRGR